MKHYLCRKLLFCFIFPALALPSASRETKVPYRNPALPVEKRVDDLLKRMTLHEKVGQLMTVLLGSRREHEHFDKERKKQDLNVGTYILNSRDAAFANRYQKAVVDSTRLGIPALFGGDVIHGRVTTYQIPLGASCSLNPELVCRASAMAAREMRLCGAQWTYAPMVDVAHDPRWGRVMEGYGEDAYVASRFSEAAVRGFQGERPGGRYSVAACLKHYVGYGASEAGRDYVPADISRQMLWDTYLPPFEAGVKAGAASLMSAFNILSGVPASANPYTLTEVLRKKWKTDAFVVSDYGAVKQLQRQGVARNPKEAVQKAFDAGVDVEMSDERYYGEYLEELVREGSLSEDQIDAAVRRVLKVKFDLGLFENPYCEVLPDSVRFLRPEDRALSRELAEESFVLLKNENHVLPLSDKMRVAVVGPFADDGESMLGSWASFGNQKYITTILSAMRGRFGAERICYAKGCEAEKPDTSGFEAARLAVRESDVAVLCLGEMNKYTGENASRYHLWLPEVQERLLETLAAMEKPVVVVLTNGRPMILTETVKHCDAILDIWKPGVEAGMAVARMLAGDVSPSGRLTMTFPADMGQIPIYYNRLRPARKSGYYKDGTIEPLFSFGSGLTYADVKYDSLTVVPRGDGFEASVRATNTGGRSVKASTMWYVSALSDRIARPARELRYFDKQEVRAGENITFRWTINPLRDLGYVDSEGHRFLTAGTYTITVEGQSTKITVPASMAVAHAEK